MKMRHLPLDHRVYLFGRGTAVRAQWNWPLWCQSISYPNILPVVLIATNPSGWLLTPVVWLLTPVVRGPPSLSPLSERIGLDPPPGMLPAASSHHSGGSGSTPPS
jgi:hypothetical protein